MRKYTNGNAFYTGPHFWQVYSTQHQQNPDTVCRRGNKKPGLFEDPVLFFRKFIIALSLFVLLFHSLFCIV
jgi:hypothetical protein